MLINNDIDVIETYREFNQVIWLPNYTDYRLTPSEAIPLVATCPKNLCDIEPGKTIVLKDQGKRETCPELIKELHRRYPAASRSWLFLSTGEDSTSPFKVHRDVIPVFLICLHSTIEVQIWEVEDSVAIDNKEFEVNAGIGKVKESKILEPGDAVILPRGSYHYVIPSSDRVSVTIGFNERVVYGPNVDEYFR